MSTAAADLIEANFSEFLLSMGRAGGASERSDDEIAWTIGGSPIGYHNAVVRCTAPEGRSSALVNECSGMPDHAGFGEGIALMCLLETPGRRCG